MSSALTHERILFVLPTLDLGGAERQAVLLASWLRSYAGADVAVAALFGGSGKQAVRAACMKARLPCLRLTMPGMTGPWPKHAALRQFAREVRFLQPSVLMPYLSLPNIMSGLTWRATRVKTCIWNQRDSGIELPMGCVAERAAADTPAFVANSEAGAHCLTQRLNVPVEQIAVVPNAVALPQAAVARDQWRQAQGIGLERLVVSMVANVQPHKDHATAIRAWALLCRGQGRVKRPLLLLAGECGVGGPDVAALAASLGVSEDIRLLGAIEDIASLLGASDAALLSSPSEGLPNAILEAMAAGLPVAGSDNAGMRAALGAAQWRYLAPPGDAAALADRLHILLNSQELRYQLGAANQERALSQFTVERLGRQSVEVIAAALRS